MRPKKINPRRKQGEGDAEVIDISTWPTRSDAGKILGVSLNTIKRWQDSGDLNPIQDKQGFWRFDPDELKAVTKQRGEEVMALVSQTIETVVSGSTDLTKQAQGHVGDMAGKLLESYEEIRLSAHELREENKSLRDYIRDLEKDRREAFREAEAAKGKVFERQIEKEKIDREEKRIDDALGLLTALVMPIVMDKISKKTGVALGGATTTNGATEQKSELGEELSEVALQLVMMIGDMDEKKFGMLIMAADEKQRAVLEAARAVVEKVRQKVKAQQQTPAPAPTPPSS